VAVAVDFGTGRQGASEHALAMASDAADRITLLHVVAPSSSVVPAHLIGYGIEQSQDPVVRDAERRLNELVLRVERRPPATIHTRVLLGDTTTEISRAADSIGADVLIVGVPKRGILSRVLFGTTASHLLRAIRIALLAVPDVATTGARQEDSSQQLAA
jgi:nucleotide-binding universal stress UspA family protein